MPKCHVLGCNESDITVSYHQVPFQNQEFRKKWLILMRRNDYLDILLKGIYVCSNHFHPCDFTSGGLYGFKRLKPKVLPSIFSWSTNDTQLSGEELALPTSSITRNLNFVDSNEGCKRLKSKTAAAEIDTECILVGKTPETELKTHSFQNSNDDSSPKAQYNMENYFEQSKKYENLDNYSANSLITLHKQPVNPGCQVCIITQHKINELIEYTEGLVTKSKKKEGEARMSIQELNSKLNQKDIEHETVLATLRDSLALKEEIIRNKSQQKSNAIETLMKLNKTKTKEIEILNNNLKSKTVEIEHLNEVLQTLNNLVFENLNLKNVIEDRTKELQNLNKALESKTKEFQSLDVALESKTKEFESLNVAFESKTKEFQNLDVALESKTKEFQSLDVALKSKTKEFESLNVAFESKTKEFENLDVALKQKKVEIHRLNEVPKTKRKKLRT